MTIYKSRTNTPETNSEKVMQREETQIVDISNDIITQLANMNDRELALMRYMNKSVLNFLIKHEGLRDTIIEKF